MPKKDKIITKIIESRDEIKAELSLLLADIDIDTVTYATPGLSDKVIEKLKLLDRLENIINA